MLNSRESKKPALLGTKKKQQQENSLKASPCWETGTLDKMSGDAL